MACLALPSRPEASCMPKALAFDKIYGRTTEIGMLFYHSVDTIVQNESTLAYYPMCDESGYPIYVYWFKIERFEDTFKLQSESASTG